MKTAKNKKSRPVYPVYVPPVYLTPEDPDAFKDYPPLADAPPSHMQGHERCPKCKGHGGWNLQLGKRPSHGLISGGLPFLDTPEYWHKFAHHKCSCSACWGWGWIEPGSCPHDYDRGFPSANDWKCRKCEKQITVDSSD